MANNLRGDGNVIMSTATAGAVTKGWLIKKSYFQGVAKKSATGTGGALPLAVGGEWTLEKIAAASTSLVIGQKVYSRATGSTGRMKVLGVATGAIIGVATAAAATGDTTAKVMLLPAPI